MAAAATLKSTTLENQLLEIVELISIKQGGGTATNPDAVTFVTAYNRNNLTGQYTISLSIPSTDAIDPTDGSIDILADAVYI
jgi:hypothetical protein